MSAAETEATLTLLINPTTGDVHRPATIADARDFVADGWRVLALRINRAALSHAAEG